MLKKLVFNPNSSTYVNIYTAHSHMMRNLASDGDHRQHGT